MNRRYIQRLHMQNFGCLKDVELTLTPLHALIGPNDSGKSTVLMALRTLTTLAAGPLSEADDSGKISEAIDLSPNFSLEATVGDKNWWLRMVARSLMEGSAAIGSQGLNVNSGSDLLRRSPLPRDALAGSLLLRLEPDALRQPTTLIPDKQPLRFANALGVGLPALYDALLSRDLPAYMAISAQLVQLFPTVKGLSLKNHSNTEKAIGVQLKDGTFVGANFMSEGMLYFLAYAIIGHVDPTAVILIEEPENGLHPARIHEVMRVLREISKTTQVIIATHSPLVVNELGPDEVTVLTRDPTTGTKATRIKDTPNFAERSNVYALGELWVSYADGLTEQPLFTEPEQATDPGEPVDWSESST